jgi:hypothetical protein
MAKTILNLKLHYRGKLLDIAKYGRDFTNKLYIGSSKFLFWQILDSKFPEQHLFLKKKDNKFFMEILPSMDVTFKQNDQELNKDALKSKKLLVGNEIQLNNDMTGIVQLAPDWVVTYEFMEPWVKVLTDEERQIVNQYARRAELQPFEKFTRNFLLAATVLTIIALIMFDTFKPKVTEEDTLEERWEQMQAVATKIDISKSDIGEDVKETRGTAETTTAPTDQVTTTATSTGTASSSGGSMSKSAAKAALSGLLGDSGFNPGSTGSALVAVTSEEDIVASSLGGGKGGGGGAGKGPGKAGSASGSGSGAGFGSVFDPTEVSSGTSNLAGLSSGRPQGKLSTQAPTGDVTTYVGNVGKIVPVGKPSSKVSAGVVSKFSGPEVKKVSEGAVSSAPPETRSELQKIEQRVARYKPQIKNLFNKYSQVKAMYGSIRFTLYIDEDGSLAGVQITPISGEFYPEFLTELEKMVKGWRFENKNLVPYEFMMTFTK